MKTLGRHHVHTHMLAFFFSLLLLFSSTGTAKNSITAELTTLPKVPAPTNRSEPAHVMVNLEAKEFVGTLADGVQYKFWSFNGTVPGPMMRIRVGDTVELHLKNSKDSKFPHNMDLHAVNGPGGGAGANLAAPGQEGVVSFKALNPGLYMYHCASPVPNIPAHIANGMYGMILVEPEEGLPKVDQEYAIVQSEFFTMPSQENGVFELSMEKGLAEHPDHVVFNGKTGALTGEGELTSKAGESVRLYFGNIGPNSVSSFHVIGEIFDTVYVDGAIGGTLNHNVQTVLVPSAGTVIAEFKVDVPGAYLLVDHSIFRVAKGALGILSATGEDNPSIFDAHQPE
ncbi:MAG: copper-containing nitrite reductase [Nitrospirales bacterium]|nr:MAG: copper-containing nitrite reductase [Nitrospirales bacterium]